MVQQLETTDTLPPGIYETCDECTEPAVWSYRWDWGAVGKVCALHGALLQQKSVTLERSVALHPIAQSQPAPLMRDERTKLVAKTLVLEAELEEAKAAGLAMYRKNGELQIQLNTAMVRERELKAQAAEVQPKLGELERRNTELDQANGALLVELERLRALEKLVAERAATEHSERGLDSPPQRD
jgi:hypothetical protein